MVQRRLCAQPLAKRHCEGKKVFSGTINMVTPEEKRRVVRKKEQTSTAPFSGITCFLSACLLTLSFLTLSPFWTSLITTKYESVYCLA